MNKLKNKDIVCIAGVDFEPLWARTQQLVWRIPESNNILYVEAPVSILAPCKDSSLWYKWNLWRQGIRTIKPNLHLYSPPLLLPLGNRCRFINKINQWFMGRNLKKISTRLGFQNPILLTYLPNTADMVGQLDEELLVYDCVDEHSAFQGFNPRVVAEMEIDLIKKSNLVFTTAQPLYDDKKQYNEEVYMLRNAADVEHFNKTFSDKTRIPEDIVGIKGPVLGFIGRIKEWIDLDLLKQVAAHRPDWSIIMVGPVEIDADINAFKKLNNVYFTGSKSKEELPSYLKKFDVCLNPFRESELSYAVNPLKLYEYLASGKPLVSTPMPEMDMLQGLVEIGQGRQGFIAAVERALADTEEKRQKRLAFSQNNSWEKRIEVLCDKIAAKLLSNQG